MKIIHGRIEIELFISTEIYKTLFYLILTVRSSFKNIISRHYLSVLKDFKYLLVCRRCILNNSPFSLNQYASLSRFSLINSDMFAKRQSNNLKTKLKPKFKPKLKKDNALTNTFDICNDNGTKIRNLAR